MKEIKAMYNGTGKKICIVVSKFNDFITSRILAGALECLRGHGTKEADCTVAWVPGAFEIAPVAKRAAEKGKYDAVICLGAVIRGSTPHFDYISQQVARGVGELSMSQKVPVVFGVLTADSIEQAIERAGTKMGNKGWDAALSALEMINLYDNV